MGGWIMIKKRWFFLVNICVWSIVYSNVMPFRITDIPFECAVRPPTDTYHRYCKSIYSQSGEDGILEQLLKELHIKNGSFCEFGASDGINVSNTYNLIQNYNFSGISIERDKALYERCLENYKTFPNVQVFHGSVLYDDKNNDLNAWLRRGNLPYDLDILSIDIDCDDYYNWESLTGFAPKILVIEINTYRDPVYDELPRVPCKEYNIDLLKEWFPSRVASGCSFMSAIKLGLQKGYIPVAFTGNLTFVRKDLVQKLKEFPYIISDNPYDYLKLYSPLILYGNKWYTNTGLILNEAICDYYREFHKKNIDINWLEERMRQILNSLNSVADAEEIALLEAIQAKANSPEVFSEK
jgi:hypothetical protein